MERKKLRKNIKNLTTKLAIQGLKHGNEEALAFCAALHAVEAGLVNGKIGGLMDLISTWVGNEVMGLDIKSPDDFEKHLREMQLYLEMASGQQHGEA